MLRKVILGFAIVCLVALTRTPAQAHFIWLDLAPTAGGDSQARLYFSEEPEPGEPHLVGKVAHTKTWVRDASGKVSDIKLGKAASDDLAALVASCATSAPASLEGTCDYGVYSRGPTAGPLLQYYAKRLAGDWTRHPELARAERLKLDIVPHRLANKLAVDVLYDGRPVAEAEVVFIDASGEHHDLKTNAQGRAEMKVDSGRMAVRAARIEADRSGERDGKPFKQAWHYCTLVLDVPAASSTTAGELSAGDALVRARDGRAIWKDFPGFTADVTIRGGGKQASGKLTIDADGIVSLEMSKSPLADWAEEQLNSLVQHRMPDGEVTTGNVTYADDDVDNPLGRKIDLGDPSLQSAYRLKDEVIMEVNRSMGKSRFTISVLEIVRNAEDKYLPRSFTMNFFDSASGELQTSLAYFNDWQRVGSFDLPKKIIEVDARKGGSTTKQILYTNSALK
ncbi:MAG: DUF3386 family protein [Pirellulales bacterium]